MNPSTPHLPTPHILEDDLILYQLQESPDATAIRAHLETCSACAELAASIAETLRVFSAGPVPQPNLDQAWQRLRPHLPALSAARPLAATRLLRFVPAAALALAALLLVTVVLTHRHTPSQPRTLATNRPGPQPGPLTTHPVDSAVAVHLDSAERFLTEVSHTSAPLDPALREQAQILLAHNALYVQSARSSGDLADAAVLEKLGRVLTAADHEPDPDSQAHGWHIRFELNANGLLLDLRILRQNQSRQTDAQIQPSSTQDNLQ